MKIVNLICLMVILLYTNVFSQDKKNLTIDKTPVFFQSNSQNQNNNPGSSEINSLNERIKSARNSGNDYEVQKLNEELNQKLGITEARGENVPVYDITYEERSDNPINNTTITRISDEDMIFNEFATVTEQIGPTKGRIWAIYRWKEVNSDPGDPMHCTFKYSDNGGILWKHYITFSFTSTYFSSGNYLDAEFLFRVSDNMKKLFVIFSIEGNPLTKMAFLSLNADTLTPIPVLTKYAWVNDSTHTYRSAKMTSDNANYLSIPYLYFCAAETFQSNHNTIRSAVCSNPFSANPGLSFNPSQFVPDRLGIFYDQFDFCYFRNNLADSILFVLRSQSNQNELTLYRSSIAGITSSPATLIGNLNGVNKPKNFPRVASDGSKNIMMVFDLDYTMNDQDVLSYESSGGSMGPYTIASVLSSLDKELYPEIVGRYHSNGSFYCSAVRSNFSSSSVPLVATSHNVWTYYSEMHNSTSAGFMAYDSRPGFRFVNGDSCFAIWSASGKLYSSAGCSFPASYSYTKNLQLKLFIEGPYVPGTNQMVAGDTVRVYIRSTSTPYNIIDSAKGTVSDSGTGYFTFVNPINNINYFLVVKSRNIIETWSKNGGEKFLSDQLVFDFTTSNSQAFGNNLKQIDGSPVSYGIFSGDIIQDGFIDVSDIIRAFNDATNFVTGYVTTDLNRDDVTDISDIIIVYNNSRNFVSVVRP